MQKKGNPTYTCYVGYQKNERWAPTVYIVRPLTRNKGIYKINFSNTTKISNIKSLIKEKNVKELLESQKNPSYNKQFFESINQELATDLKIPYEEFDINEQNKLIKKRKKAAE